MNLNKKIKNSKFLTLKTNNIINTLEFDIKFDSLIMFEAINRFIVRFNSIEKH